MKLPNKILEATERFLIRKALMATRGNKAQASRILGISRQTLQTKEMDLGPSGVHDAELVEIFDALVSFSKDCERRALELVE